MKKILIFLSFISVLSACDFIRTVASRPTSAEIEAKRIKILQAESARAARIDSVKEQQKILDDSLEVEKESLQKAASLIYSANLSGIEASRLKFRYYIVIGSFSKSANADKLGDAAASAGYPVTRIAFNNGFSAVAVCGGNALNAVLSDLDSLRGEPFCPADVWILKNE